MKVDRKTFGEPGVTSTSSVVSLTSMGSEKDKPEEIIWWASGRSKKLVQASTFNLEDQVITHMLYEVLGEKVPVLFVDTKHHFAETLAVMNETLEKYDLDLVVCHPDGAGTRDEFSALHGEKLWERDLELFHRQTKIEPFQKGLEKLGVDAWITGRRRDQSSARAEMRVFEEDHKGRLKANPLAYWTRQMVLDYVRSNGIPYNVLHDRGYPSVGDEPLTEPVDSDDSERAGRWRGSPKSESGMHY
jgi:phosphoadenosine phosphosulfate reductase